MQAMRFIRNRRQCCCIKCAMPRLRRRASHVAPQYNRRQGANRKQMSIAVSSHKHLAAHFLLSLHIYWILYVMPDFSFSGLKGQTKRDPPQSERVVQGLAGVSSSRNHFDNPLNGLTENMDRRSHCGAVCNDEVLWSSKELF